MLFPQRQPVFVAASVGYYERFVGRTRTHHIAVTGRRLTADEVERFRTLPEQFIANPFPDEGEDEPQTS